MKLITCHVLNYWLEFGSDIDYFYMMQLLEYWDASYNMCLLYGCRSLGWVCQ